MLTYGFVLLCLLKEPTKCQWTPVAVTAERVDSSKCVEVLGSLKPAPGTFEQKTRCVLEHNGKFKLKTQLHGTMT